MLLAAISKAVAAAYPNDPSQPSVTVAWLEGRKEFYVSICRYTEAFGKGKKVMIKASHTDLEVALESISAQLQSITGSVEHSTS